MRLRDVLVSLLREESVRSIYTPMRIERRDPIQHIAVEIANGMAKICRAEKKTHHSYDLSGRFIQSPADAFAGDCDRGVIIDRKKLIEEAERKNFPYIVIDCSFFDMHTEKEKSRLKVQLKATLGVIRDFMWDEKLIVCGKLPAYFMDDLPHVQFFRTTVGYLKGESLHNPTGIDGTGRSRDISVILLDPNAEDIFTGERADCYIIGGIVDKSGNKRGLTSKIGRILEESGIEFRSMRIELKGDVIGVPDRINAITEVVLLSVLEGLAVEEAIRKVQSPLIAKWRLKKELPKISRRMDIVRGSNSKVFRFVRRSDLNRFDWLNLTFKEFYDVCRQLGFLVLSDDLAAEIEMLEFDSVKGRYILRLD